jgi:hypothetical protein
MKLFIVTSAVVDDIDNQDSEVVKVCKTWEEAQQALKEYHDNVPTSYPMSSKIIDDEFAEEEGYFDMCSEDMRVTANIEEVEI